MTDSERVFAVANLVVHIHQARAWAKLLGPKTVRKAKFNINSGLALLEKGVDEIEDSLDEETIETMHRMGEKVDRMLQLYRDHPDKALELEVAIQELLEIDN